MSITAMKQALEALEELMPTGAATLHLRENAITALRQAIEQAEKQQALDKKADNARELGLDYEQTHTDHPMRHWDRTCPACVAEKHNEPVAWMFQHDETGRMSYVSNDGMNSPEYFLSMNPRYGFVCALYTAPHMSTKPEKIDTSAERVHEIDKSIHEEIERLKTEIKRLKELAEYRLRLLMKMPEQAETQEVVAYIDHVSGKPKFINGYVVQTDYDIPLYAAPPRKEWVGLTVDEIVEISESDENTGDVWMALNVQAKLKEKNT